MSALLIISPSVLYAQQTESYDYHQPAEWDLTREVLKAFPDCPWGDKPKSVAVEGVER